MPCFLPGFRIFVEILFMGSFLYFLVIRFFEFLLLAGSLFNRKAKLIVQGRKNTFSTLEKARKPDDRIIWFHCASLGEFEQGRPVMEFIRDQWHPYKIYVSFFSSSGYEIRRKDPLPDAVFYLPADTRKNARKLIAVLKPEAAIFVKYEFWYHYFAECNRQHIPLISISTILRPDQVFFRFYGKFYRNILKRVDAYYVQDRQTQQLLEGVGLEKVQITGDTRFDRVLKIRSGRTSIPGIEEFISGHRLIILGSTWKPDIDLWKSYINRNAENYKFLIAPHHIDEGNLRYIENQISQPVIRFSKLDGGVDVRSYDIMIMDRIGLLSSAYYYGYINYVGGSFSEGLHNVLEPAVFGIPVLLGRDPSNRKYLEASGLTEAGGAFEVGDPGELERVMDKFSGESPFYREASSKARNFVENQAGATGKIVSSLQSIIKNTHGRTGH